MFRDGPAHLGVSPETAIGTATASTLTAGWMATVGTASYSSPAVVNLKALGEPVLFVGGSSSFSAYPASGGNLGGNLYALNPVTGATLWKQPGKSAYWSSPTISQGTIYITSRDGKLLTFARSGG